jgi:glycosyltransferase involved in cell wall biosynthesis
MPRRNGRRHALLLINSLGPGGGESQMQYLATGLAELGWQVTLVCQDEVWRDVSALQAAGVRVLRFGAARRRAKLLRMLPSLVRLARGADVVVSSMFDATLYGRAAAIAARRPAVTIEHTPGRDTQRSASGKPRGRLVAMHNSALDPLTYAVIATAYWQLPILRGEGIRDAKLRVIHNGVTVEEIRGRAEEGVSRAELGVPEDARVLVHVARFAPQKNQPATLAMLHRLRDLGDVHALFLGDGALRAEVEAQAEALGVADRAHFLGARGDVPRILRLADVFVLPSFAEAMPLSILEALAVGIPIVSTDIADIRRIIELTGGGIVIPPGDDDAYERALRDVLGDPGLRERLAAAAADGGRRHFDYRRMSEEYAAVLAGAVDGTSPVPLPPAPPAG